MREHNLCRCVSVSLTTAYETGMALEGLGTSGVPQLCASVPMPAGVAARAQYLGASLKALCHQPTAPGKRPARIVGYHHPILFVAVGEKLSPPAPFLCKPVSTAESSGQAHVRCAPLKELRYSPRGGENPAVVELVPKLWVTIFLNLLKVIDVCVLLLRVAETDRFSAPIGEKSGSVLSFLH